MRTAAAHFEATQERRFLYVGFAMLQCFLCAGVIIGWTSILPVLEQERIYNEYCAPGETICEAQSEKLHFAFTIAGSSSMCSNLVLGLVFDRFGPRFTKVLSLALIIIGAVLMGKAQYGASVDLLLPGMTLLGFAGPGVQLSGIHLSNLFPEAKALVTCFIVGALQLSFFVFTVFDLLYERAGVSKEAIFNGYAFVLFLTLIGSAIMDPDAPFELNEQQRQRRLTEHELLSPIKLPAAFNEEQTPLLSSTPELSRYRKIRKSMSGQYYDDDDDTYDDVSQLPNRSFKTQVRSAPFLLMCFFFAVESLWCNFFIGSVTAQLRSQHLAPETVSALLAKLAVVLPSSVVFIPLVGYLLEAWGYTHVTFLCAGSALLFTVLSWSTTVGVLLLAFVLYALFRTILFSVLFAYIGQTFGFQHFGALTGIAFCVGAVVGLLQTPIAAIGNYETIGYIQFGTLLTTLVLPIYEFKRNYNQR
uniref:Major facilitator superfamily (MFS) profile domain-containing protein n=1 Tax=Globisporangium ultimum (strain ATCC 200006 / CBS 805.95 / DAOM BR144) TaxID=431595 RepID=K3WGB5_GLOUD